MPSIFARQEILAGPGNHPKNRGNLHATKAAPGHLKMVKSGEHGAPRLLKWSQNGSKMVPRTSFSDFRETLIFDDSTMVLRGFSPPGGTGKRLKVDKKRFRKRAAEKSTLFGENVRKLVVWDPLWLPNWPLGGSLFLSFSDLGGLWAPTWLQGLPRVPPGPPRVTILPHFDSNFGDFASDFHRFWGRQRRYFHTQGTGKKKWR